MELLKYSHFQMSLCALQQAPFWLILIYPVIYRFILQLFKLPDWKLVYHSIEALIKRGSGTTVIGKHENFFQKGEILGFPSMEHTFLSLHQQPFLLKHAPQCDNQKFYLNWNEAAEIGDLSKCFVFRHTICPILIDTWAIFMFQTK